MKSSSQPLAFIRIAAAVFCLAGANAPAFADATAQDRAPPLTADNVGAWLDGIVPASLRERDVAGAVVVVAKDGKILFERGYGYSDLAARKPMDPAGTLMRAASISKLFTWTAVMQLAEAGKLALDRDVNDYLDFKIPDTWPRPITLRNLMTHTAGFEETDKNTYAPDPASMPSLGAIVKSWVPERIYPPGTVVAYSNYGAALAGYIVERVSGEPFAAYVARHILKPLEMRHATFRQPLPPDLAPMLSRGYVLASQPPQPFELVEQSPAGALSVTADDMARFMLAELDGGAYAGGQILKPQSVRAMQDEAFRFDPLLPGMGLGFWHQDRNGHVVVSHHGDTVLFHSGLYLVTDAKTGLFVSENSSGTGDDLASILFPQFMDRYFPAPPSVARPTLASAAADGQRVAGLYENSRNSLSNFMIVEDVFNERTISENGDGTISLSSQRDADGQIKKWREVAPYRWQELGGDRMLDAEMKDGRVVALTTDAVAPISEYLPVPFWRSAAWNIPLLLAALAVLVAGLLSGVIAGIVQLVRGRRSPAAVLVAAAAVIDLAFVGGWTAFIEYADAHVEFMSAKSDWLIHTLQLAGAAGVLGSAIVCYLLARDLGKRSIAANIALAIFALACLAIDWFAFSLKFVGWSVNY